MSRHTRGSRQDIHSTRVPHTEEGCGWLISTLTDTKSSNHRFGHQHGSGACDHDHGTTNHSSVDTTGDQPKNWRATSREPSRPVRFPERWSCARRHKRPGELRCDSETAARASSLEQTIPSFRLYETGVPSATSRTMLEDAWIALSGFECRQDKNVSQA